MSERTKPQATERGDYYQQYIDHVDEADFVEALAAQSDEFAELWDQLDEARASHRYAAGKWSVKEVLGHLIDCERVFAYRALAFARGESQSLPGFDQDDYVANSSYHQRSLRDIQDELAAVRSATISMFKGMDSASLTRIGHANGQPMSPRAAGYVMVGHVRHHFGVIRDRYLS